MALTVITILWSIFIVGQLRVFVLSGTIAQWWATPCLSYISPELVPGSRLLPKAHPAAVWRRFQHSILEDWELSERNALYEWTDHQALAWADQPLEQTCSLYVPRPGITVGLLDQTSSAESNLVKQGRAFTAGTSPHRILLMPLRGPLCAPSSMPLGHLLAASPSVLPFSPSYSWPEMQWSSESPHLSVNVDRHLHQTAVMNCGIEIQVIMRISRSRRLLTKNFELTKSAAFCGHFRHPSKFSPAINSCIAKPIRSYAADDISIEMHSCVRVIALQADLSSRCIRMCRARQNSSGDASAIFWSLLSFFLECVFTLIEYITKFATIMAAITGEPFLAAGRKATDLLKRQVLPSSLICILANKD